MEDERRFTRLWSFCYGKAMSVISLLINAKVLNNYGSFQNFLNHNENMHAIFHKWIQNIRCCQCSVLSFQQTDRATITEPQFTSMYDLNGKANQDHERKNDRGKISKYCLCKISAKPGVSIYNVDIGTVHCLLKTCAYEIFQRVEMHIVAIRDIRNYLAHSSNLKLTEAAFNQKWTELEAAVLSIAYIANPANKEHEAQQITDLKGTDISRDEIVSILDKMNEDNRKQWEAFLKTIKEQGAIQQEMKSEIETLLCRIKNLELMISRDTNSISTQNNDQQLRSWNWCVCFLCYEQQEERTVLIKWKIKTPDNWNVNEIKRRLEENLLNFRDFIIKCIYLGSIIIETTVSQKIIENHAQFNSKVVTFFNQLVEVGRIDVDTPAVISVMYTVMEKNGEKWEGMHGEEYPKQGYI